MLKLMKSVVSGPLKMVDPFTLHILILNGPIWQTKVKIVFNLAVLKATWVHQLEWLQTHDLYNASLD